MGILTNARKKDNPLEKFSPSSTFLEVIEYDPENQTMDITFRSGTKTRYLNVDQSTFLSFKQSPTHSAYYARAIKGNLLSTTIIDASIGTNKSAPLKQVQKEQPLDRGLKSNQARDERIFGTVNRAINAAAVESDS